MRKLSILIAAMALSMSTVGMAKQHNNVECPQKAEALAANIAPQQTVRIADALLTPAPVNTGSGSGTATR